MVWSTKRIVQSVVAIGVVLVQIQAMTSQVGAAPALRTGGPPAFTRVAVDQFAAAQPTDTGRRIVDLHASNGKIYAGYGDYATNTGPIVVAAADVARGDFRPEFVSSTEAIYNYRDIGGQLWAPSTDPRETGGNPSDFAIAGPWHSESSIAATHLFDAATFDGRDRWLVGSQHNDAVAWRSTDGGVTWQKSLVISAVASATGDFARFYFAVTYRGRLYVQAVDSAGGPQRTSKAFDGTSWVDAPSMLGHGEQGSRPEVFAGRALYLAAGDSDGTTLRSFDGRTTSRVLEGVHDFGVAGGIAYVLDAKERVLSSSDLKTWNVVGIAPANALSVTENDGTLYVGTATSELWSLRVPGLT